MSGKYRQSIIQTEDSNENTWKRKYLESCIQHRHKFPPLFISVEGLLDTDTEDTLKRLYSSIDIDWRQLYSQTCGYVWSRVDTTMVQATQRLIQVSAVPASRISVQRSQWEDRVGLRLYRYTGEVNTKYPHKLKFWLPTCHIFSRLNQSNNKGILPANKANSVTQTVLQTIKS